MPGWECLGLTASAGGGRVDLRFPPGNVAEFVCHVLFSPTAFLHYIAEIPPSRLLVGCRPGPLLAMHPDDGADGTTKALMAFITSPDKATAMAALSTTSHASAQAALLNQTLTNDQFTASCCGSPSVSEACARSAVAAAAFHLSSDCNRAAITAAPAAVPCTHRHCW